MKKPAIMNNLSRTFSKVGLQLKKHSPEILVAVGVVGTVTSTVMACKATLKVNDILDETKDTIDKIHECVENPDMADKYSIEDSKKDLATVYVQTGVKLAKLYAPAVALGVLSVGCIVKSNNILTKRNAALAAAYTAVDKSFKEYRGRVVERFGTGLDRELKYDIKAKEIEETVIDEKGKEKKVKKTIETVDGINPADYSDFARFFDERSDCWEDDPEMNLMFLKAQQKYANDLLMSRGYLFLNEVYDLLDIPITKAGQAVGWIYDKTKAEQIGDGYVDFGIYQMNTASQRFVNGYEPVILLDFNVDGTIWDLI